MMSRISKYLLWSCVALLSVSCRSFDRDAERFQKQLLQQQQRAEEVTERLGQVLTGSSLDSLRLVTTECDDVRFYVFDASTMVYWSDNRLVASQVYLNRYDVWETVHFDNAWTIARWSRRAGYNILTVIPIKNDYRYENDYLRNEYQKPFRLKKTIGIRRGRTGDGYAVKDASGNYLFTLYEMQETDTGAPAAADTFDRHNEKGSFSYQNLLSHGSEETGDSHRQIYYYIIFTAVFLSLLLALGIYGLVRSHGIRNMLMSVKFQYLIVLMVLVAFGYVFVVSVYYVNHRFAERQAQVLLKKAGYIQKSLQNLYPWTVDLNDRSAESMNVELRDLCFTYETDIQVYDMRGNLVGASSPAIFEQGIVSRHISSEPFFSGSLNTVLQENIGSLPYLTTYTEFYNGSYVQIGYIEVPHYVTQDERRRTLDDFLARVFPPYIAVMVLAVLLGLVFSRSLTRPLKTLTAGLSRFRIGQANAHLKYDGQDEIGALVREYNRMVDELVVSTEKLARSEREGAWRTMARQIAHEINNPLTPMKLNIQQLQRLKHSGDPRFEEFFEHSTQMLIEQIDSLSHIAQSFSSFAKMKIPEVHAEKVDVAAMLFSVITLFRSNSSKVPLRYVGAERGVYAFADGEQLPQVFNNLLKNALQALEGMPDGDIIIILKDLQEEVEVTISDNGTGIPEDIRDKVFMPNFTTKSTGTGLGLAISKNIVEGSGGSIRFETSPKGTSFFVSLKK